MSMLSIHAERLLGRLEALGQVGRSPDGTLSRLAATDADRAARDLVVGWMEEAGLTVEVDAIGNLFGTWHGPVWPDGPAGPGGAEPVMAGSHLDTVIDAGIYDGSYGVLAALEAVETLRDAGARPARPITVVAFTNEEGVRFTPDMMGSLVHAGGLPLEEALASVGTDGARLGDELERIGYAGSLAPGAIRPHAFLELHVEQGPVLESERLRIGVVQDLQGISWQRITLHGQANHAGTTPMALRRDAGVAAARLTTFIHDLALRSHGRTVATVGTMRFAPEAINIIPARATLTIDLRDPDEARLRAAEAEIDAFLARLTAETDVTAESKRLVRFEPVRFDENLVAMIEEEAAARRLPARRMTSGAGHDAQMIARIAPAAMIFVPSAGGISHSPHEHSAPEDLVAGANVLLGVIARLAHP